MVLYVHGRPTGHPLHMKYGRSVANRLMVEDPWIRWHDRNYAAPVRYLAWLVNAFCFVRFRKTIVVTEGLRITLVLARFLSFGNLKLIALVDDESPYFIYSNYYSWVSRKVNTWAYRQYSAWICIGKMETELMKSIVSNHDLIFTGYNGVSSEWLARLSENTYDPASNRIVFIGNIPSAWRLWYKGLDLMVAAVSELIAEGFDVNFDIAGEISPKLLTSMQSSFPVSDRIRYVGRIAEPYTFFKGAALYLHTARGEGWGITVNEAMSAGVVPIVSEWTGSKECAEEVSAQLVVPLEKEKIKMQIKWFLGLSSEGKIHLSQKCKEVSERYTECTAVSAFEKLFGSAVGKLPDYGVLEQQ
jgi:glycosyltransferase involved in cell wall biosynthesis